jgi:hypothetical protein
MAYGVDAPTDLAATCNIDFPGPIVPPVVLFYFSVHPDLSKRDSGRHRAGTFEAHYWRSGGPIPFNVRYRGAP